MVNFNMFNAHANQQEKSGLSRLIALFSSLIARRWSGLRLNDGSGVKL